MPHFSLSFGSAKDFAIYFVWIIFVFFFQLYDYFFFCFLGFESCRAIVWANRKQNKKPKVAQNGKKKKKRRPRAKRKKKLFITRNLTARRNERPHFDSNGLVPQKGAYWGAGVSESVREWEGRRPVILAKLAWSVSRLSVPRHERNQKYGSTPDTFHPAKSLFSTECVSPVLGLELTI